MKEMDYEKPFFHAQSGRRAGRQGASILDWALLLLKVLWAVVLLHHPSRSPKTKGLGVKDWLIPKGVLTQTESVSEFSFPASTKTNTTKNQLNS